MRVIDSQGRALIQYFEGLRLTSYQDKGGVWTIGYGHTGPDVKPGMTISDTQANQLFDHDIQASELSVADLVKVSLSDNEFAALVSLVFNIGIGAFSASTLLRMLNAGDYEGAGGQFLVWNKVTIDGVKQVDPILVARRKRELQLWLEPDEAVETVKPVESTTPTTPAYDKALMKTKTMVGLAVAGAGSGLNFLSANVDFLDWASKISAFSDIMPQVHVASFYLTMAGLATSAWGRVQNRMNKGV